MKILNKNISKLIKINIYMHFYNSDLINFLKKIIQSNMSINS